MIKKIKNISIKMITIFLLILFGTLKVDACTYQDKANLNQIAALVKTNYEIIEDEITVNFIDPDTQEEGIHQTVNTSFKISIYNLSEDIYLVQKNSLTNETKNIYYKDAVDGVYTFVSEDTENIIKYDYDVYSNISGCTGEILKSYSFLKPKRNMFSQYRMCQGLEDVPYCRTFITEEINITESKLEEELVKYLSKEENKKEENKSEQTKSYIMYVTVGVGIVVGTLGAIYIVKRRSAV